MILTEFDYEKNAIINPWHTSDMVQGMPKVAVTCFSRVTFARMLSAFGGERIASTNVANMEIPVYKTVYHGYEICLFMSDVGGTIKPLDEELIVKSAKKTGKVVTAEEHSVIGGLGSAVCDALCKSYPVPVKKIGMQDTFGESGSAAALVEKYQLDGKGIYAQVKEFMK